jgi:hypothetical protein
VEIIAQAAGRRGGNAFPNFQSECGDDVHGTNKAHLPGGALPGWPSRGVQTCLAHDRAKTKNPHRGGGGEGAPVLGGLGQNFQTDGTVQLHNQQAGDGCYTRVTKLVTREERQNGPVQFFAKHWIYLIHTEHVVVQFFAGPPNPSEEILRVRCPIKDCERGRAGAPGRGSKSSTRATNAHSGLSTVVCTGIVGLFMSLSLTASVTKNHKMAVCPTGPNKGLDLSLYAYCTSTCQRCISLYDPFPRRFLAGKLNIIHSNPTDLHLCSF